ncbi:1,2-phenylacetyl-CoA epoxidase subunit PaaC [Saccharopolyspora taberi]|uniref:Phenylacetate-CoA oxygenase subunit PaaC n=1 Tax=Saccharopolyspora taberi TaxID=60895 RepID=A0ABN3VJS8_9PSEU
MHTPDTRTETWVLGAPNSTVDRTVPGGVSTADLATYCLMLGDDALVLSGRLSEWGARVAELEEDVVLGGIALDLLRQARTLLTRAGEVEGAGRDEDRLAYFRDASEFRNVRLAEIACGPGQTGDFAATIARLLVLSTWRLAIYERLVGTRDPVLSDHAARCLGELTAHRDHALQWTIRLGDGTAASREAMAAGLERVWPLTAELFRPHPVELALAEVGCAVDPSTVRDRVATTLDEVLSVARLDRPDPAVFDRSTGPGGRDGVHTGAMEFLLAEMQYLARSAR